MFGEDIWYVSCITVNSLFFFTLICYAFCQSFVIVFSDQASGEHAGAQRNQDEKPVNGELEANLENNASNYSSDYVDCMDKNDGNTAKGSEAQVSSMIQVSYSLD